jgi:hypothetical protein
MVTYLIRVAVGPAPEELGGVGERLRRRRREAVALAAARPGVVARCQQPYWSLLQLQLYARAVSGPLRRIRPAYTRDAACLRGAVRHPSKPICASQSPALRRSPFPPFRRFRLSAAELFRRTRRGPAAPRAASLAARASSRSSAWPEHTQGCRLAPVRWRRARRRLPRWTRVQHLRGS